MARYELNSKYILKTDNANYAVDLTDVKAYLKVDTTSDDTILQGLIKAATLLAERYTRREFLTKTFTMYLDFFPYSKQTGNLVETNFNDETILVKRSKLQTINSIKYYQNEVLETMTTSLYSFTKDNDYSRIYLKSGTWADIDNRKQAVEIDFDAGYGATNTSIPQSLKDALKIIIAYMYSNRGDCILDNSLLMLSGAMPILDMYQIIEI